MHLDFQPDRVHVSAFFSSRRLRLIESDHDEVDVVHGGVKTQLRRLLRKSCISITLDGSMKVFGPHDSIAIEMDEENLNVIDED